MKNFQNLVAILIIDSFTLNNKGFFICVSNIHYTKHKDLKYTTFNSICYLTSLFKMRRVPKQNVDFN
jgi:hypothetical protein